MIVDLGPSQTKSSNVKTENNNNVDKGSTPRIGSTDVYHNLFKALPKIQISSVLYYKK